MLLLISSLLNAGIFLYFKVICFRATRLLREGFGLFASLVFVLGLLSFIGPSDNHTDHNEPDSNMIKTWKFISKDSVGSYATSPIDVNLEKTIIANYTLSIYYGRNRQQIKVPISAYSSTSGLVIGTYWKPMSIYVNRTVDENKFHYSVVGTVEWKLLGLTFYSQPKVYTGTVLAR